MYNTNQNAQVIWLTGLSGAGKTTLAMALKEKLLEKSIHSVVLDGDVLRTGINVNLGFSTADRLENIRRVAEIAKLFSQNQQMVIVATISPQFAMRELARDIIGNDNFIEIYISTSLAACEKRDVKGLYQKARAGTIKAFTGISDGYEIPKNVFEIDTENIAIDVATQKLYDFILSKI